MPLKLNEPQIDAETLLLLGRIMVQWSRVEEAFDRDIGFLSKNPKVADLLPKEIPDAFSRRLTLWHRVVRAAFHDVPQYLKLAEEVREAATLVVDWRNKLMHGWLSVENGVFKIVINKYVHGERTMLVYLAKPDELTILLSDIRRLEEEVVAFGLNHYWLKTHRVKPPQS